MAGSNTNAFICFPEFLDTVPVSEIIILGESISKLQMDIELKQEY
jgi:hypothetical protein